MFYAIYAQVETSYLTPRIMKSSVDLSPLGVLVALLMGSKLAGRDRGHGRSADRSAGHVLIQEYLVENDEPAAVNHASSIPCDESAHRQRR